MNLNDVPALVERQLDAHGLLAKGWFFKWSRAPVTFGTSNKFLKRILNRPGFSREPVM